MRIEFQARRAFQNLCFHNIHLLTDTQKSEFRPHLIHAYRPAQTTPFKKEKSYCAKKDLDHKMLIFRKRKWGREKGIIM